MPVDQSKIKVAPETLGSSDIAHIEFGEHHPGGWKNSVIGARFAHWDENAYRPVGELRRFQEALGEALRRLEPEGTRLRLVSFSQDWGRQGCLEGLFVYDDEEWVTLQALIKHEIQVNFGEALGKHSECRDPIKEGEIKVESEDQGLCREFRRLKLSSGSNPVAQFDPSEFWEDTYDSVKEQGKDWPPNPDGTWNWSSNE